jgi:hypothetical protein
MGCVDVPSGKLVALLLLLQGGLYMCTIWLLLVLVRGKQCRGCQAVHTCVLCGSLWHRVPDYCMHMPDWV